MLFKNSKNGIRLLTNHFLNDPYLCSGVLESNVVNQYRFPFDTSSISNSKRITYIKAYNEFLERKMIGHNTFNNNEVPCLNLINGKKLILKRSEVGYGYSHKYGIIDTTGSASGKHSEFVKSKCLLELIEKNEVLLLWYKKLGKYVEKNKFLRSYLSKYGFESHEVEVFYSSNISNTHVFIVLVFEDEKIIGSGVSANLSEISALKDSIKEAKLLSTLYRDDESSPYNKLGYLTNKEVISYINNLKVTLNSYSLNSYDVQTIPEKIIIDDWINDLVLVFLSLSKNNNSFTIRCVSTDLLNCIPAKNNIKQSKENKIIKKYAIVKELENIPDSVIL